MRIGLFGGSFNPIHRQHLNIALLVRDSGLVDEVWFVPVYSPVHKAKDSLVSYKHRAFMVNLAIEGNRNLLLCNVEKELGNDSFTVNTLRHLKRSYPEHEFFLIIGGDSLSELHTWRDYPTLAKLVDFIVIERPGSQKETPVEAVKLHWVETEPSDISSSSVRRAIKNNLFCTNNDLAQELPPSVHYYILRNVLYFNDESQYKNFIFELEKKLYKLPEGLIKHIESVARVAFNYALELNVIAFYAMLAGLGHDLFRLAGSEEIKYYATFSGYELNEIEKQNLMLAHGVAAAGFFSQMLAGADNRILEALRFHTIPLSGIGNLARILVVADCFDPLRNIAERDRVRKNCNEFDCLFEQALKFKQSAI